MEKKPSRGRPPYKTKPEKKELKKFYIKESRSIREVAKILGWSKDREHRLLKSYDIKRDKRIRTGKLSGLTLV